MKKNAMLKIAAILMVAVLLTTCAISSTFAKYVTEAKGVTSNTATVAKWGITISSTSDEQIELFKNNYGDVVGKGTNIVVAPGTASSADFEVKVEGTAEVDFALVVEANLNLGDKWAVDGTYYCPLVFTVDGTPIEGMSCASASEFETKVENAIAAAILGEEVALKDGKYTKDFKANDSVPASAADGVAVSWAWAFSNGVDNDAKDTVLGKNNDATVSITYSVGATQIGA